MVASQATPVHSIITGAKPGRLADADGIVPTSAPTASMSLNAAIALAHGRGSNVGRIAVFANKACVLTLYVFDEVQLMWGLGGANASRNSLTFSAAGEDDFAVPVGQLYHIISDTANTKLSLSGNPAANA